MFTLKTQGVFKRFQREHILSLLSVFSQEFRMYEGDGCTFIPGWGRWGCEGREVVVELTRWWQCAKLPFLTLVKE